MKYKAIFINAEGNEQSFASHGWGHDKLYLTIKDIEALKEGKAIGYFDGEYTTWIVLKKEER